MKLEKRADGAAIVYFDTPDSPVNVLSRELFDEFTPIIEQIEGDDSIRAVVLASAKPGTFIAGANLKQLVRIETPEEGEQLLAAAQKLLTRVYDSKKPFVAAIHGAALGGGLEVALSCRYRLAADDPKTVLGLPEVQLGLLPAGTGTQRLPRLIGLPQALPLLLTGRRLRAKQAYRLGLVDALTSPGGLTETAVQAALRLADGKLKPRRVKRNLMTRLLESGLGRGIVFNKAAAGVKAKTRGLYPAPGAIIECVKTGLSRGFAAGIAKEAELFGKLVAGPEAKSLIGLFESMTALKKPMDGAKPLPVRRLAILGGGFMGAGVAQISTGLVPVTVKDINEEVLGRCAKQVYGGLSKRVKRRSVTRFERDRQMARLHLTTDDGELAGCDLIVEAVFEDLDLKRKILAATESHVSPKAVFASNTSALPIADIAKEARHPERVLGMHYFSPVPKMPLLELIVTPATADWAVATARDFGIKQGKTVVVVKDGPGFYTSRILSPYIAEATMLVQEGSQVQEIDNALLDFGFPVGPLALVDEVGLDVAAHVARNFGELFAHRGFGASDAFARLNDAGYAGRKNKRGFYKYDDSKKGKKEVNEAAYKVLGSASRKSIPAEEVARRVALLMVNEAVYCLQEQIIASPQDGDVAAILGLGFPPFRGGPFRHVDAVGTGLLVETMQRLVDKHGPRFAPAPLLADMARENRKFHGDS